MSLGSLGLAGLAFALYLVTGRGLSSAHRPEREGESAVAEFEQQVKGWWSKVTAWLRGGQRTDASRKAKAAVQDLRDSETARKAEAAFKDLREGETGRKAKAALQDLRDSDVVGKARDTAREAIRDLRDSDAGRKAKAALRDLRDSAGTGDKS
jgi:hypothetical protein